MIMNTTVHSSALKRDTLAVAYHCIREKQLHVALWVSSIVAPRQNLSNLLTKPLGPQVFQHLVKHEQFPLWLQDEGELNSETVKKTKHGQLVITYPKSNRDIVEVLTDLDFVNNILKMDKKTIKHNQNSWKNSQDKTVKCVTWELVGTAYSPTEWGWETSTLTKLWKITTNNKIDSQ